MTSSLPPHFCHYTLALLLICITTKAYAQECSADSLRLTTTDALGPFYLADSELTSIIAPRQLLINPADVFTVHGSVLGNDCVPLTGASVEAWYAGDEGPNGADYSDTEFRGQVTTDQCGNFQFTQTFPAVYPQRPIPHIHYRIATKEGAQLLVTQLYFEGVIPEQYNPDTTKISRVINEPDGSRSAEFHIFVGIPGTADRSVCGMSTPILEEDALVNMTKPENTTAVEDEPMETLVPNELGGLINDESMETTGEQCGPVVCEPGKECCNA